MQCRPRMFASYHRILQSVKHFSQDIMPIYNLQGLCSGRSSDMM